MSICSTSFKRVPLFIQEIFLSLIKRHRALDRCTWPWWFKCVARFLGEEKERERMIDMEETIYSFQMVGRYADSTYSDGNKIVYILFL